jgi:hypothetical protein
MTFRAAHRAPSRYHVHTEAERSTTLTVTPTKPYAFVGSCAGRSSSTNWCSSPRSTTCWCLGAQVGRSPSMFAAAGASAGAGPVSGAVLPLPLDEPCDGHATYCSLYSVVTEMSSATHG